MPASKNILVTGANGLIGSALCEELRKKEYCVRTLSRQSGDFKWDITSGHIDKGTLDSIDCVVHLAGESIAQRWTDKTRKRILQSRISSTNILTQEIHKQNRAIQLICASGINYYGFDRASQLTENSPSGLGFLAEVCRQWEKSASTKGLAAKIIRSGVVLSPKGGMLRKVLPPFKCGLGGCLGSGRQMMSWISLEDICRIYIRAIEDETLTGAINAVAPKVVSNRKFTKILGKALHRPTVLPLPSFIIKTLFGRMGTETILSNLHIQPDKLRACGFTWSDPCIDFLLNTDL